MKDDKNNILRALDLVLTSSDVIMKDNKSLFTFTNILFSFILYVLRRDSYMVRKVCLDLWEKGMKFSHDMEGM